MLSSPRVRLAQRPKERTSSFQTNEYLKYTPPYSRTPRHCIPIEASTDEPAEETSPSGKFDFLKERNPEEWDLFQRLCDNESADRGICTAAHIRKRLDELGFGKSAYPLLKSMDLDNTGNITFEQFLMTSSFFETCGNLIRKKRVEVPTASASSKWATGRLSRNGTRASLSDDESEDEDEKAPDGGLEYEVACKGGGVVPSLNVLKKLRAHTADFYAPKYKMGAYGGEALGKALAANAYIVRLEIPGNCIGDRGAIAIADSLEHSKIVYLNLADNGITGKGASCLITAIQIPKLAKSVLSFDISDNPVWDAVPKLMQLMSHNIALTELNLGNTGCSNNAEAK
ncbi:hypothetical protein CYMTET_52702 [Cymbomonas tetramitiformis]|uniref:EF-hand domain-containing protein n=1 Tax=Cymbomonas tetramitiformis TaxID=36881 RepID=A0AAE0EQJ3_9CHLO|nr:hypothetical protein CYMTET_52702 [Cymbomonas tetramitiformis]